MQISVEMLPKVSCCW